MTAIFKSKGVQIWSYWELDKKWCEERKDGGMSESCAEFSDCQIEVMESVFKFAKSMEGLTINDLARVIEMAVEPVSLDSLEVRMSMLLVAIRQAQKARITQ